MYRANRLAFWVIDIGAERINAFDGKSECNLSVWSHINITSYDANDRASLKATCIYVSVCIAHEFLSLSASERARARARARARERERRMCSTSGDIAPNVLISKIKKKGWRTSWLLHFYWENYNTREGKKKASVYVVSSRWSLEIDEWSIIFK